MWAKYYLSPRVIVRSFEKCILGRNYVERKPARTDPIEKVGLGLSERASNVYR